MSGLAIAGLGATTAEPDERRAKRRERGRRVFVAASLSILLVVAATGLTCIAFPAAAALAALVATPGIAAGLALAWMGVRLDYRPPSPAAVVVALVPVALLAIDGLCVPGAIQVTAALSGMMIMAVGAYANFGLRPYAAWLAIAAAISIAAAFASGPSAAETAEIVAVWSLASAFGLASCRQVIGAQRRSDIQASAARDLYARMRQNEDELSRQGDFLIRQQDTLIVQQAELLKLNADLETIARMDPLTGLGNRLRLNEDLAQLAARIDRHGGSAGILLMDLDRFKRLNDVAGHLAGDAALRGVADVLRKTSRVGDGLYRYGGEEFLIVLHDCNANDVRGAGQRYVSAIEAAGMAHPDNPPYGVVTASAGAVVLSPANCVDIDVALHDADEALYVAKSRGRNRIEVTAMPREAAFTADQQRAAS